MSAGSARRAMPAQGHFSVSFERSGSAVSWRPESGTLLDLAEAEGIPIDSGCRAGQCGSCTISLVSGEIESLGAIDQEPEGRCLACLAVPKSDLVINA